jgi:hypothetical protein
MNQKKDTENTISNIWAAQENLIHFYKVAAITSGAVAFVILIFTVMAYFRDPVVVVRTGTAQEFYALDRSEAKIGKREVEAFIADYLKALYVWEGFDPARLEAEIKPYSEDGLVSKVLETQTQKFGKVLEKKIAQDIAFVRVQVLEDRVLASFLRILRVEGIPLIVPTELGFALIQGSRTRVNPMGIYISGITESENAK